MMMLASSLSAILISTLAVNAHSHGGVPRLQLDVSGGDVSDGLGVVAKLTNKGSETVTLLNDPRGILSNAPTNAFEIDGDAKFAGIRLKWSPNYILRKKSKGSSSSKFYTVIEPGKSVTVKHDLTSAYSFQRGGARSYKVNAKNLFVYVDEDGKAQRVRAKVGRSARMKVTRKLLAKTAKRRAKKAFSGLFVKRAGFRGCDDKQIEIIFKAAAATKELAAESLNHLTSNEKATERYTTWWGEMTTARRSKLIDQYTKLSKADFEAFNYDCTCKEDGVFAFVYPDEYGIVNLCPAFWQGQTKGTDSQAGTILHEASHFTAIASTEDHGYGQETCKKLAKQSPDEAIMNADSHEYFSENNPEQEKTNSTTPAVHAHVHDHGKNNSTKSAVDAHDHGKTNTASAVPAPEQQKSNSTASAVPGPEAIKARAIRSRISRRAFV